MARRLLAALALILLAVLPASAAPLGPLGVDWDRVKVGDYQVYVSHEGGYLLLRYAGPVPGGHHFESWFNFAPIGKPTEHLYTDDLGQITRFVHVDGSETRYFPNDCSRTIGPCSYRVELGYGMGSRDVSLMTRATAGGYAFNQTSSARPRHQSGGVSLLENGLPRNIDIAVGLGVGYYHMKIRAR